MKVWYVYVKELWCFVCVWVQIGSVSYIHHHDLSSIINPKKLGHFFFLKKNNDQFLMLFTVNVTFLYGSWLT